jgi:hypothetical protein
MVFVFNNFLAMTTSLFASSRFAGIVLHGFSSPGGDLRSGMAPTNARRFLTHDKSVGFKGGVPVNFVSVEGKVPSPAGGHEVAEGDRVAVSGLLPGSNVGLPTI